MKFCFKKLCLVFGVLLFSLSFVGCGGITQEQGVNAIDAYMQEIRDMDLEYSLFIIECKAERGKEAILQTKNTREISKIKKDTLNAMKSFILSDAELLSIKQWYCDEFNNKNTLVEDNKTTDEVHIKYFLGEYQGYYLVTIKGNRWYSPWYGASSIDLYLELNIGEYRFEPSPERVSLWRDGERRPYMHELLWEELISEENLKILNDDYNTMLLAEGNNNMEGEQ